MRYDEAKKAFIKDLESFAYKHRGYDVFGDFVEMAAISLYQPFRQSEKLEKRYLDIVGKYTKEESKIFGKLLRYVVEGLTDKFGDFLGECYIDKEFGNKHQGQFFTPYTISKFMAALSVGSIDTMENKRISEPAAGSGGMIIAIADHLQENGINYQKMMDVQAIDVSPLSFYMCYIQLSLLHIPAECIWGNTLKMDIFDTWYTPAYLLKKYDLETLKTTKVEELGKAS